MGPVSGPEIDRGASREALPGVRREIRQSNANAEPNRRGLILFADVVRRTRDCQGEEIVGQSLECGQTVRTVDGIPVTGADRSPQEHLNLVKQGIVVSHDATYSIHSG